MGAGVVAAVGAPWLLSALIYFIVGDVLSISTSGLFSDNEGFWARVVDGSAVTMVTSALGWVLGGGPREDDAVVAEASASVGGQDRHLTGSSEAEGVVVLSSAELQTAGPTMPDPCRRRTGVLYGLIIRPLPQIFLRRPKRLGSGVPAVLLLGT